MPARTGDSFLFESKEVAGGESWPHADGVAVFTFLVTGVAVACILPQKETESNRAGLESAAYHLTGVQSNLGAGKGRHKAGTYGDLMGLAGRGLAEFFRLGTCYECRHQVGEACCWPGALRGRSPRTREGRIGPTAQLQWSVVSSQWSVTAAVE